MLTGDSVSYGAIRPRENFDPAAGHWGAIQVLARYSTLAVDDVVFSHSLAAADASPGAQSFTIAINWFPNGFIKYYGTFERTVFDRGATTARPSENVFVFRTQVAF
jgi:phosphate-selective porin OprO/OprP